MLILSVDTSGPSAGAAIREDGRLLVCEYRSVGLTHSQTILPIIDNALRAAGREASDVDLFACVAGPGSFTGVRIGVCLVKGMARAAGKQCAEINALEALAANHPGFAGAICPILDARRDQVYSATFDFSSGEMPVRLSPDRAASLAEVLRDLPYGKILFTGDGCAPHASEITEALGERAIIAFDEPRADAACRLAERAKKISPAELLPIYLRAPQAERAREANII